ncbi:MAG: UbiA family prenyltransferase [archaeon]
MSLAKKFYALILLTKPLQWSKSFANMLIGSFIALYLLNGFVNFTNFNPFLFLLAFFAVGPLLWGGFYGFNDWIDREKDKLHPVKKSRPIPSGLINERLALIFSITLVLIAFFIGFYFFFYFNNFLFLICLIAMTVNQFLYCTPPVQLKTKPVLDLISGSLVNPFFRFYSGWVLFMHAFNAPLLLLFFVLGLQFSGYAFYRLNSRELEKELNFRSSVVVFSEKTIKAVAYLVGLVAGISFVLMCLTKDFFPSLLFLGGLPLRFLSLVVFSLLLTPFYYSSIRNPTGMNIRKMYYVIYFHVIAFVLGFILLFLLF